MLRLDLLSETSVTAGNTDNWLNGKQQPTHLRHMTQLKIQHDGMIDSELMDPGRNGPNAVKQALRKL